MPATVAETATLAHGYTMADVDRLSRLSARFVANRLLHMQDAIEAAWFAIVDELYTSTQRPSDRDLLNIGQAAVRRDQGDQQRLHGYSHTTRGVSPAFLKYWKQTSDNDFTERMIERMALPQVLSLLTADQYAAVAAYAATGGYESAAASLGISVPTLSGRLKKARAVVQAAWVAPDSPRRLNGREANVCRYGHSREQHGYINSAGKVKCRLCRIAAERRRRATMDAQQRDERRRYDRERKRLKRLPGRDATGGAVSSA